MYNFKIDKIIANDETEIIPKQINVIIGPNNSGKSQFLRDIKNILGEHNLSNASVIINKMEYTLPKNDEEFISRYNIDSKIFTSFDGQTHIRNYSGVSNNNFSINNSMSSYLDKGNISINNLWRQELRNQIESFNSDSNDIQTNTNMPVIVNGRMRYPKEQAINAFISTYGNLFFNYMGTEEKLLMCRRQKRYGLQDYNTNFLSEVQFNSKLLTELSKHTKAMFDKDIYLDRFSSGESILFRVGDDFDFIRNSSRDNSEAEIRLKDYKALDNEGDGIKSFITNYIAVNMNDKNVLLLDEPEAFLHPPLAKQLGEIIATAANNNRQIFISTHSVDLLKGIIGINKNINIIRITRNGNVNQFNILQREKIEKIISNPLLSSSNVLNGLFCEKVYICEAESDEEFFQNLHDKVNVHDSAFFTHGKNKQTLKDISKAYNDLKIPNYRIYDFDIMKDDDFNRALNTFIEDADKDRYIDIRKEINKIFEDVSYQDGGIEKITDKLLKKSTIKMLDELKKNGILILKYGCLETTLKDLNIAYTKNKNYWYESAIKIINESTQEAIKNSNIYNWIFE